MDRSYVPPFRRRAAGDADAPPTEDASNQLRQSTRHNSRTAYSEQGNRGYGRGGWRERQQKDFYKKQKPQAVDPSEFYHEYEIHNHFCGRESDARRSRSSTLHDSKSRPEELSHVLLFTGANPRWPRDRIVFAKTNLNMLPEYAVKKAEYGEWDIADRVRGAGAAAKSAEDGSIKAIENKDAVTVPDRHRTEAVTEATLAEAQTISASGSVDQGNKYEIKQVHTQDGDSTTAIQEPSSSSQPDGDETEKSTLEGNTNNEKREDQDASLQIEGTGDHQSQATPISTPSPVKPTSHLTHTNHITEAQPVPSLTQSTATSNRMEYADICLVQSTESSHEPEVPEPIRPAIAPIEYVPANPLPIAAFEERRIQGRRNGGLQARFEFKGWFKVSRVNILAPHSAQLVRMLQQKWERKDRFGKVISTKLRDASAWNASLAHEWAVVHFELVEREGAPPPPQIEKLPESELPVAIENKETRSVNEMLTDMRLNDGRRDRRELENPSHATTVKSEECPSKDAE
ncbi:hypothetical protein F5Y12DRAFT_714498 [Xylaria sp. FL1777]|nr:hypothetical protein F5Y12DRAFT_714498 [Xylaria sp. FL1777]